MVRRVNECQCVNTGAILLLRQGMFMDGNFSAAINEWKVCLFCLRHMGKA